MISQLLYDVHVTDEFGAFFFEDDAAGNMVMMVVAVDNVFDRFVCDFPDFIF